MQKFLLVFSFLSLALTAAAADISLSKGMIIRTSVRIIKRVYKLDGTDSLNKPVIIIEGDNITVDFNHCELKGSNNKLWPNEFYGCAILVRGGKNITIKNAEVHGFKVAIMGLNSEYLILNHCDLSYNYRQKLNSGRLHEDVSDWMSYHHNENNEWLRYGAGIYLRNCNRININNNEITGGQCALMMTNCNDGVVTGNNFSFNSGIGIGMYHSSRNSVVNNILDFNVRGYSHGIFNRGQDSADILVFDQCNDNTFAYNSATHGGDGFFLWAGQHTMDSGEGGCNDNKIFGNDFSFAPTNGVEITFSRNQVINNIIKECDNGIWGGYSFNTLIAGNDIENNHVGIAIEHGQDDTISGNKFVSNKTAIKLWARAEQPKDWGYARNRDTKSRDYTIVGNAFTNDILGLDVSLTNTIHLYSNSIKSVKTPYKINSNVLNLDSSIHLSIHSLTGKSTINKRPVTTTVPEGRKEIRITKWGPYDHKYPILWLSDIDSTGKMFFDILGPQGNWTLRSFKGIKNISAKSGVYPTSITAQKTSGNILIELISKNVSFVTQFGRKTLANKPFTFTYSEFDPRISWDVKWYAWDKANDPNKEEYANFTKLFSGIPLKHESSTKLDYSWWGEIGKNLPADSFATVATGLLKVPKGTYDLGVTADDLVKVWIDGKLLIDFWDASKYFNDEDAHHSIIWASDGKEHNIRIVHVENSGYATLIFSLEPI